MRLQRHAITPTKDEESQTRAHGGCYSREAPPGRNKPVGKKFDRAN
jgi:hypothetical protein